MVVFGTDCTITIFRNNEYTPIPYTFETLREKADIQPLDPLLGEAEPVKTVPVGTGGIIVLGCIRTRICLNSLKTLAELMLNGYRIPFDLYKNRIAEKLIYRNIHLISFIIRGERDEPVYMTFDIEGRDVAEWEHTTENMPWTENPTFHFEDGSLAFENELVESVYRFTLERQYKDAIVTTLTIYYPLRTDDLINSESGFTLATITLGNTFRISLEDLRETEFQGESDSDGEVLVYKQFMVAGSMVLEIRNAAGVWEEVV
jgi:hypothetical protein